jgi:hypothetical protein
VPISRNTNIAMQGWGGAIVSRKNHNFQEASGKNYKNECKNNRYLCAWPLVFAARPDGMAVV